MKEKNQLVKIGKINYKSKFNFRSDVLSVEGSSSTLTTGDSAHPILIGSYTPSGRSGKIYNNNSIGTLTTGNHGNVDGTVDKTNRVRKITPRESFRLQGVKDEDFDKLKDYYADNMLYHLAGDSICVEVLKAMFKEML
jgi:DNA (cytosine-5)-methyltransferase 1